MSSQLPNYTIEEAVENWIALGRANLTVSVCFGPSYNREHGGYENLWSVQVMSGTGEFQDPFAAETLPKAIAIAVKECQKRGWLGG